MVAWRSSVGSGPIKSIRVQKLQIRLGHLLALAHRLVRVPGHVDADVVQLQPHLHLTYTGLKQRLFDDAMTFSLITLITKDTA